MQLKCEHASLVLLATSKLRDTHVLVVTFGLLVDAEGKIMPAGQTWSWLAERMGKQALDSGLKKSRGTFAVQGQAYALTDAQRAGMAVRVRLGTLEKTLHVFPPRQWNKGLLGWMPVTTGQIDCLPLSLENAYGGSRWADNPVGKGHCPDTDTAGGAALAQLEVANLSVCDPEDRPATASFMPLPPQSAARSAFMGTLDEDWAAYRAPFLPLDTDARWFDEVAQDQCSAGFWRGDEAWSVTGMHPTQAQVSGRLPGLRPRLFVERTDKHLAITEAPMDLDTVWLFPEAQSVLLLYRAEVSVLDIDAQDIATLAMALERVGDAERDKQTWIDRLWPRPPVEPVEIPPTEPQVFDSGPMIASVRAAADAIHAELSVAHEQSLQVAQDMATGMGMPFNRADYPPLAKLDFSAFMREPQPPAKPFDPGALRAEIETEFAKAKADSMRHARSAITRLDLDVEKTLALARQPVPEVDLMGLLARLDLPLAQQADMVQKVAAGFSRAQAIETTIDQKLAAVDKALAADRIKFGPVPTPAEYCNLTRESLQALHVAGKSLQNLSLNGLDLSGIDLGQADLKRTLFENCQLKGACLANADLSQSQFVGCDLSAASLDKASLQETVFQRVLCQGASFKGANLLGIRASKSDFSGADFTEASLQQAQLNECSLDKAQLSNASLSKLRLNKCDLSGAILADSNLHKATFYDCTLDATDMRRATLSKADFAKVVGRNLDLRECNLQNLRVADHCVLPGVRLDDADLTDASVQDADLNHASLRGTRLNDALLTRCDLSDSDGIELIAQGVYLSGCDLSRADWSGANLLNGRLRKVCLEQTNFSGSNLHGLASDAVHGNGVRLEQALMTRCRLKESLTHA
ncbi:DUF2169 domain-containing protein [Pseudomonas sp. RTC3]|uniref:DUF2169 family type VI secretion system accessory protein n=1 Tax=Pseudomonas sp. 5C2 TaxID=3048588 RepID=UPI002AB4399C|nr:DUF2169 domain-containing protein [Pseudomonas sp. 5C2]MDY7565254.1 DUF2169 domain-containing protein [Pseudomonas sp. 5C2]MEB0061726.1 DUF2169 domain-containing protein [Pseudomonas sp. RTC3]MEB0239635.1 DUF2169 domain-containing protein [Pseudomonas sp. 5C2]